MLGAPLSCKVSMKLIDEGDAGIHIASFYMR